MYIAVRACRCRQLLATVLLSPEEKPLLERFALAYGEALKKGTTAEGNSLFQRTGGRVPGQEVGEVTDVDPDIRRWIELYRPSCRQQEWGDGRRITFMIAEKMAQIGESATQIRQGGDIGAVGPEQTGQRFAGMRPSPLHGKVDKQRPGLV